MLRGPVIALVCVFLMPGCRHRSKGPFLKGELPSSVQGAPEVDFAGKTTTRTVTSRTPIYSGYEATVAHGYFTSDPDKDLDFLEVAIERRYEGGSNVFLMKAFSLKDLPPDILDREAKEIVFISDGRVVFDLGTVKVTSRAP